MGRGNWKVVNLGSIADVILGGTPSTSIPEYWIPEIDWVTAKDISESVTAKIYETERLISKLGLEKSPAKVLPPLTTVIIARGATMGKCRMLGRAMALNQTCYGIVAKESETDPIYLYYYLSNLYNYFRAMAHGSVFDTVIGSGLRTVKVNLPSIPEQRAIAGILGALDDKIELNRRMNRTLESMAWALYREWFVVNLEVKDWVDGSILDFADLLTGGTPSTAEPSYWNGAIDWVSAKDVGNAGGYFLLETEKKITPTGIENSSTKMLPAKTTVVTARGTVGACCLLGRPMTMNQTNYGLKAKEGIGDYFVYFTLKNIVEQLHQQSYGTIFDTITTRTFREITCKQPPMELVRKFGIEVSPLMEAILNNQEQNRTLVRLRDLLLPKLIKGEIRVNT